MHSPDRRRFLTLLLGGFAAHSTAYAKRTVKIAQFTPSGQRTGVVELDKIHKSDAEWKAQLTPLQFEVTRKKGTERAFTGKYADNHADGLYLCICCETPLFDSKTKFESGTGWPSCWAPIAKDNVLVSLAN